MPSLSRDPLKLLAQTVALLLMIFGFAVPLAFADGESNAGVFGYFSYELPFVKRP